MKNNKPLEVQWLCRRTIQPHSCAAVSIILVPINIIILIVLTWFAQQPSSHPPTPAISKTDSQGFRVSTDRPTVAVVKTTPVSNRLPPKAKLRANPFSFASYYGHHMVLQQAPRKSNIWGYARKEGETITISVNGKGSVNTTSFIGPIPSTSVWSAQLPPVSAGGPYDITATSSEETITITDVLFGDVWICSGQSNMQFTVPMVHSRNPPHFQLLKGLERSFFPELILERTIFRNLSRAGKAVCFSCAMKGHDQWMWMHKDICSIGCSTYYHRRNALPFQLWKGLERTIFPNLSRAGKAGFNASSELADAKNHPNIRIFTVFPRESAKEEIDLLRIHKSWSLPNKQSLAGNGWTYFSAVCWLYGKYLSSHFNYPIGLLATSFGGTILEAWSSPTALTKCGAKGENNTKGVNINAASVLWNAMVHPLLNMTIYGVVWYQGEANSMINRDLYNCTFPAMIDDWRERFYEGSRQQTHINFPFGFVQLSPWRRNHSITQGYPDIRWHQTADYGYVPNDRMKHVFMAVAMDLPDFASPMLGIHPRDKQDVAVRLFTAGLAVAYNQTKYSKLNGPYPSLFTVLNRRNSVVIDYDNKGTTLDIRSPAGFEVTCIYLSSSSGNITGWFPLQIASHDNTSVTLDYSKQCLQSKNMMVASIRYAWRESPCAFKQCAVYNKNSGYPAPPFVKNIFNDQNRVKIIK